MFYNPSQHDDCLEMLISILLDTDWIGICFEMSESLLF